MTEYPGAISVSFQYLTDSILTTVRMFLGISIICAPILLYGSERGPQYFALSFIALVGWSIYSGQDIVNDGQPDSLEDESRKGKIAAAVFALTYYNVVVLISMMAGIVAMSTTTPAIGVAITFLYPAYDVLIARYKMPMSLLGIVIFLTTLITALHSLTKVATDGLMFPSQFTKKGSGGMSG